MNRTEFIDCVDFYLWSIGELQLSPEPDQTDFLLSKEES